MTFKLGLKFIVLFNVDCSFQEENERTQQKMKDLEAAHKESMNQFKNKIVAEQQAQVDDLRRQMENDKEEVSQMLPKPLEFGRHLLTICCIF